MSAGDFLLPDGRGPAGEEPPATWTFAARLTAGLGLGCAGVVLVQGILLWLMLRMIFGGIPAGLRVDLRAPSRVVAGRPFPLVLTIRNEGATPLTLSSVQFSPRRSGAVSVTNPDAQPAGPAWLTGGAQTWSYTERIPPGGRKEIRLQGTCTRPGTVNVQVDVQAPFVPIPAVTEVEVVPGDAPVPGRN